MALQPQTPLGVGHQGLLTSGGSSNKTYTLAASPGSRRRSKAENCKPTILRTCGAKPACLVNASVTYCGDNQIYAFGGFDQYTDEVYNHVLKLDLNSMQWSLVDNYGDIPGVRMGHTACLWHGSKLLIHGGENEHREYLSDVVLFDLKTATWTQPEIRGPIPTGRARHSATVFDEKLFILGGLTSSGADAAPSTLDDICYLDLRTWTWSRSWSFVTRFDHATWVYESRLWVYGGMGPDMEKSNDLWWLDLKSSPAFKSAPTVGGGDVSQPQQRFVASSRQGQAAFGQTTQASGSGSGYAANSSSIQIRSLNAGPRPVAPGSISSIRFISGPNVPVQASGTHFQVCSSGAMLDIAAPGEIRTRISDCSLTALDLDVLQWQTLAEGAEVFESGYRWSYCAVNEDATKVWLLGCLDDVQNGNQAPVEELLSEILSIDLRRYGLLGNEASAGFRPNHLKLPPSDRHQSSPLTGLGADMASMFDRPPESGAGCDFIVTGLKDYEDDSDGFALVARDSPNPFQSDSSGESSTFGNVANTSRPIHVHRLILQARWPHFSRVYAAQMAEFHTRKMHIPESYSVVRAFLYYLYTDSIAKHDEFCPRLDEVAGLLVMAHVYDMPQLRLVCVHRLSRELDVDSAAVIWERAGAAEESWLRRRAASFCLVHWGRVVRTEGFRRLNRDSLMELCEIVDVEGRVVGGEELEVIGGLGGGRLGGTGPIGSRAYGVKRIGSGGSGGTAGDDMDEAEGEDEEGMEMG